MKNSFSFLLTTRVLWIPPVLISYLTFRSFLSFPQTLQHKDFSSGANCTVTHLRQQSTEDDLPSVTAIIPFDKWARRGAILQAIRSVVNQTYRGRVDTVVVDTSSDPGAKELDSINFGKPVHILHVQPLNGTWAGFPRNVGILHATSDYVAFLDSDDVWFPNKLEVQFEFMRVYNLFDFVTSETVYPVRCRLAINESAKTSIWTDWTLEEMLASPWGHGQVYREVLGNIRGRSNNFMVKDGASLPAIHDMEMIDWHNCATTSSVLVKRSLLTEKGLHFKNTMRHSEDWDLWKRIVRVGEVKMGYLSQPTIAMDYTCHGGAATNYAAR